MRSNTLWMGATMKQCRRIIGTAAMIVPLLLCGHSQSLAGLESLGPGTHKRKLDLRVLGFRRSYLLHIPENYNRAEARPLVVALHGAFSTAEKMEQETGLSELADREGFLVLYPNGITLFGWLQHWNALHCCGKAMKDRVDDLGFVAGVIDEVREHFNIDTSRIYMVGYSNGGMLAHLFAAQKPETLAALAVIAAAIGSRPSPSEPEVRIPPARAPMPVLVIHGREDDHIPYEGGSVEKNGHFYVSVKGSIDFWLQANGVSGVSQRENMAAGRVIKETWKAQDGRQEVVLCTLEGWKHTIPTRYFTEKLPGNDPLKNFDATEMIWDFFKSHRR